MNQIDNPPLTTPLGVDLKAGVLQVGQDAAWSKWFQQIAVALLRPTLTKAISFPSTAAGGTSDVAVAFPAGTVGLTDLPVLASPQPPAGGSFSAFIINKDEVRVRFLNGSAAAVAIAAQNFSITVLKQ